MTKDFLSIIFSLLKFVFKKKLAHTYCKLEAFHAYGLSKRSCVDLQMLSAQSACQNSVALTSKDVNNKNFPTHHMTVFQTTMNRNFFFGKD